MSLMKLLSSTRRGCKVVINMSGKPCTLKFGLSALLGELALAQEAARLARVGLRREILHARLSKKAGWCPLQERTLQP